VKVSGVPEQVALLGVTVIVAVIGEDVDLVVAFQGINLYEYADNYFDLKESLEKLFKHDVDLLEEKAIKNPYLLQSIDSSKQLIYG
jgi:hypothetical protein